MLLDARQLPSDEILETDICIIGGGAAGITVAHELIDSGLQVCLLESGGTEYDYDTQSLYHGEIKGRDYFDLDSARLRYFGGTTNHWSGWSRPLDPVDFEKRDWMHSPGWPIQWSDIEPWYQRASEICQLPKTRFDYRDHVDVTPALHHGPYPGDRVEGRIWVCSPPTRFGEVYGPALDAAQNVSIYLHANFTGFETTEDGSTATEARVSCLDGKSFRVKAQKFVLACGGIENARLLLQPTVARPQGIGNDYDQVGRYFMLHPHVNVGQVVVTGDSVDLHHSPKGKGYGDWIRAGFSVAEDVQHAEQLPNHGLLLEPAGQRKNYEAPGFDALRRLVKNPFGGDRPMMEEVSAIVGDIDGIATELYYRTSSKVGRFMGSKEQDALLLDVFVRMDHMPNPDSRVTLGEERDALGMPVSTLDWRFYDEEKHAMRRTTEIFGEMLGGIGGGRLKLADWLLADDASWPEWFNCDYHHMGTTRMSADPRQGVVDADCRVHGTQNIYVAGSSVFTTAGFSNPTLTLVALATRLADHLKSPAIASTQ